MTTFQAYVGAPWAVFALVPGIIVGYDGEIYPALRLDFPLLSSLMTRIEEAHIPPQGLLLFKFDSKV